MKKLNKIFSVLRRNRVFTRSIAMILSLVLLFYVVPSVVYAEIADAAEKRDTATDIGSAGSVKNTEVYEDTSLREESVKHFRLSDGTYVAAQYAYPVHYLSDEGTLEDIDNTLAAESGGVYATPTARIKFAKKINGSTVLFTLKDGNTKLEMSLVDAKKGVKGIVTNGADDKDATELQKMMNLERISSSIKYKNVLDGVDIEYVVQSLTVKENIIVKERSDSYSYEFELKLNGLTAALADNGDINIYEGDVVKYVIPAPVVYDSAGSYAPSSAAYYALNGESSGKYSLTVNASADWMNSDERVYPITVDPSIGSGTEATVSDTYITVGDNNSVHDSDLSLHIDKDSIAYWTVSGIPELPMSAYIYEATLGYHVSSLEGTPFISAYMLETPFPPSFTHAGYIDGLGRFYTEIQDALPMDASGVTYNWNITDAVKSWYDSTPLVYGIALKLIGVETDEDGWYADLSSTESATKPQLTISYKITIGIEDYLPYSSQDAGIAGSGNVNLATGALTFTIPTLTTTDYLMPFTPTLVYNSDLAGKEYRAGQVLGAVNPVPFMPNGFMLNIMESVVRTSLVTPSGEEAAYMIYVDSDGSRHYFGLDSPDSTSATDDEGLGLALRIEQAEDSGTIVYITDRDKTTRVFKPTSRSGAFYLSRIEDRNGNAIVISVNSYFAPMVIQLDPAGSTGMIVGLRFIYTNNKLYKIINPSSGEAVMFKYSPTQSGAIVEGGGKYLRQIDYISGSAVVASAYYGYGGNGHIRSAEDGLTDIRIEYGFSAGPSGEGPAIGSVREFNLLAQSEGQRLIITYGTGYTDVRSSGNDDIINTEDDTTTRYVFDYGGRAISVYSFASDGGEIYGAVHGKYETQENAKNSLKQKTTLGGTSVNYLLNGGLDETTGPKSFAHWTVEGSVTRARTSFGIVGSGYSAEMRPAAGTVAALSQSVALNPGTYTVSFPYLTQNSPSATGTVQIIDAVGSVIHSSLINLNPTGTNGIYNFFQTTFDISSTANYTLKIIVTNPSNATRAAKVEINEVMLEKSTSGSHFSFIEFGAFEDGYQSSPDDKWEASTSSEIEYVETGTMFGKALKINGNYSENTVRQRIFEASASDISNLVLNNYGGELTLSGYALAVGSTLSGDSPFRLSLEIAYYSHADGTSIVNNDIPFISGVEGWQFASGTIKLIPDDLEYITSYDTIKYIDVICEYSMQADGYALFDNISLTKDSGNTDFYDYDNESGNILKRMDYYNATYYYYDGNDNVTRIADTRGSVTDYAYTDSGLVASITESVIKIQSYYSYNDFANDAVELSKKRRTEYVYNVYGLVNTITTKDLDASGAEIADTPDYKKSYTYNLRSGSNIFGAVLYTYDFSNALTEYYYDETKGHLIASINILGGKEGVSYTYDEMGRITSIVPAIATATSYEAVTDREVVNYVYDDAGRLVGISTNFTEYTLGYDSFGNATSVDVGSNTIVSYEYNEHNGKLSKIIYENGYTLGYEYNELELLSKVWYTVSGSTYKTTLFEYEYTASGLLYKAWDNRDDSFTEYKYDSRGRVVEASYSKGAPYHHHSYSISYNDRDLVSTVKGDINYTYVNTSTGTSSMLTQAMDYTYTYNEEGELSRQQYRSGDGIDADINYGYDRYSRPAIYNYTFTHSGTSLSRSVRYTYDSKTVVNEEYTSSRVRSYESSIGGSSITYTYTYNRDDRISTVVDSDGYTIRYTYDNVGQLIREDNMRLGFSFEYLYNRDGNIASIGKAPYTLGDLILTQQPDALYYTNNEWGDQLTGYEQSLITYDAMGNPISYNNGTSYTFSWQGRRLYSATVSGNTYYFDYNDQGFRTRKGGTNYFYRDDLLIAEQTNDYVILYIYDSNGSPIGMQYRENTYASDVWDVFWYDKNLLGDIVAVYDSRGDKLVSYEYNAFGRVYTTYHNGGGSTAAAKNPFRYRGYYYDTDLGMYYLQTRYYDPKICRFISPDDVSHLGANGDLVSYNLYAYCSNDPVNMADYTGEAPVWHNKLFTLLSDFFGIATVLVTKTSNDPTNRNNKLLYGVESGSEVSTISGDSSKPISFYNITTVDLRTDESDVKLGVQANVNDGGIAIESNIISNSIISSSGNDSFEIMVGVDKIGFTARSGVDFDNHSADAYKSYYLSTLPCAGVAIAAGFVVYMAYVAIRYAPRLAVAAAL